MPAFTRSVRPLVCLALVGVLASACSDNNEPSGNSMLPGKDLIQVDRFGLPAIATVFIPSNVKDAYNAGAPSTDRGNFRSYVVNGLTAFGNPDPNGLADALLPDRQPINTSQPSGFLNGRRLQDDVITAEFGLIFGSNADLNDDHVDANDAPFLSTFPYLATPRTN